MSIKQINLMYALFERDKKLPSLQFYGSFTMFDPKLTRCSVKNGRTTPLALRSHIYAEDN